MMFTFFIFLLLRSSSIFAQSCINLSINSVCGPSFDGSPVQFQSTDDFNKYMQQKFNDSNRIASAISKGSGCTITADATNSLQFHFSYWCAKAVKSALDSGCSSTKAASTTLCESSCNSAIDTLKNVLSGCPASSQANALVSSFSTSCNNAPSSECFSGVASDVQFCGFRNLDIAKVECVKNSSNSCCSSLTLNGTASTAPTLVSSTSTNGLNSTSSTSLSTAPTLSVDSTSATSTSTIISPSSSTLPGINNNNTNSSNSTSDSGPSPMALGITAGVCIFLIILLFLGVAYLIYYYRNRNSSSNNDELQQDEMENGTKELKGKLQGKYKEMESQNPSMYMMTSTPSEEADSPIDSPSSFSSFNPSKPLNPSSIYSGYTSNRFSMAFDKDSIPPPPNNGLPNVPNPSSSS